MEQVSTAETEPRSGFRDFESYYRFIRRGGTRRMKHELIVEKARGKAVLDLGCVGHTWRRAVEAPSWLHRELGEVADEVVGVDILEDDVRKLAEIGYRNILVADATKLDLGRQFDLVVAGDLIEHVADLEGLLLSARRHLGPGGELLVTTPNPFYINQFLSILAADRITVNDDHVCWLDPITIFQLFRRYDLVIHEFYWLADSWGNGQESRAPLPSRSLRSLAGAGVTASLSPLRSLRRFRRFFSSDFAVVAGCR